MCEEFNFMYFCLNSKRHLSSNINTLSKYYELHVLHATNLC